MSAMGASELPEVPAASPPDSARIRAAARWTGTAQAAPAATGPDQAALAGRLPGPAARPQATRPQTARDQAASVSLRLTRRGRVVVAVAAVLLLAVLSLVIAASAQATNHPAPSGAAQRNLTQVTVRPGQSLWSIAEKADPDADTRVVIQQIIELNGLTGNVVFAGQRLLVPRG
jgi:nucleoid-associated protein YgaU